MKKIRKYSYLFLVLLFLSACVDDSQPECEIKPGNEPVHLSGIITRTDGQPRNNIYVKAFLPGPANVYFNETLATIPDGLTPGDTTNIEFPGVSPYYPLGETNEIQIFAYSGKAPDNSMRLTAGTSINNDAILSNYGKRRNEPTVNPSYAPEGTPGSTANPAEILQFRHVMTQLNVTVDIDSTETPPVDQLPSILRFTLPGVAATGRYPIRANETETATNAAGTYTINLGINYLIPTGAELAGVALTSLHIDDYIATAEDLAGFTIQPLGSETSMVLMPGYAYNLKFTVKRLKVQSITLEKINWVPHENTGEVSYLPYTMNLNFGADLTGQTYSNTGDEAINRVVLRTANRTYVGQAIGGGTTIGFVLLPPSGEVTNISLYTQKGLLINMDIPPTGYTYDPTGNSTLNMQISQGGMLPVDPTAAYDAVNNPYAVTTPLQLMNVEYDTGASYRQLNTIDLRTLNLIDSGRIFNGFGAFSGTYDGGGNRIDAIDIQASGLFASNSGTLRGIRLTTGTVDATGQTSAGSICGNNTGTIVGCINESRLITTQGTTATLGGICGTNTGRVIGCLNTGTILNGTTVGGICGNNQNPAESAIVACINTGMLNPSATDLGYIVGTSIASANNVVQTSFGLVGSAQRVIGSPEVPIGSGNAGFGDSASLEPAALRGNVDEIDIEEKLPEAMNDSGWGTFYQFSFDHAVTAVTWPTPITVN